MGSNVYVFRTVFLDENFGPLLKKSVPLAHFSGPKSRLEMSNFSKNAILAHFSGPVAHFYFKSVPEKTQCFQGFAGFWPTLPTFLYYLI